MKARRLKKLEETTYCECRKVVMGKPLTRLTRLLKLWVKHDPMDDYRYTTGYMRTIIYCSDRMNGGRARSILRLIKESNQ